MAFPSAPTSAPKMPKGQMKCFQCRQPSLIKEGSWENWNHMQVFLCKTCDRATQGRPERKPGK